MAKMLSTGLFRDDGGFYSQICAAFKYVHKKRLIFCGIKLSYSDVLQQH